MTLLGRRVGSGRTLPSGARAYGLLVKRSAGLGTINIRYKLSNTLHYTHTYISHTDTPGMRIGPVHDTGLSAVLWSSIPATASIVAPQEQNRTEHLLLHYIDSVFSDCLLSVTNRPKSIISK